MKKIVALCVFACAFVAVSAFAQASNVVVIPLNGKYKINSANCPAASGSSIAGPTEMYNFCWYLSNGGITCDQVCGDLGGANLAYGAEGEWADNCSSAGADDVSTWFLNNGNPGNWNATTHSTSYHTLGYGYDGGTYYGKCSTGSNLGAGAYPSETTSGLTRNLVCACFGLMNP